MQTGCSPLHAIDVESDPTQRDHARNILLIIVKLQACKVRRREQKFSAQSAVTAGTPGTAG